MPTATTTPSSPLTLERRRCERHQIVKDCKLRGCSAPAFTPAQTTNLSLSGALIRIPTARPFAPGDEIELALPASNEPLITSDALIHARVRRVIPIDHHHQALGIEFDEALEEHGALAA
jgi:c-di-GMP-binding flagellar brake protein YcgR